MIVVIARVGTISRMRNIWTRFIWPMWMLGCYQFSWAALYVASPQLAYLTLCNPVLYVTEGMRGALLGNPDCLPWELCIAALCFFIVLGWRYAYQKMKRLLDFV
jgi:ABC-type polysaccharide/polyol phosphate export permease